MNRSLVPSINVAPNGEHSYRFHSGYSRAVAQSRSEAEDHHEDLQHLPESRTRKKKQKSQAGIFSRLRRRLSSLSPPELPTRWTSPVNATHIGTAEAARDNLIITQNNRMPNYHCVPLPPGCIPTEVMLIAEGPSRSGLDPRSLSFDGANRTRNRKGKTQQDAAIVPDDQSNEHCLPFKVLRNNWVLPK